MARRGPSLLQHGKRLNSVSPHEMDCTALPCIALHTNLPQQRTAVHITTSFIRESRLVAS